MLSGGTAPGPKSEIVRDRQVKSPGLRITPAGARAYILNDRIGGRECLEAEIAPERIALSTGSGAGLFGFAQGEGE